MRVLTLLEAVTDGLRAEMAADQSVVVFGQDVGVEGGVFRATAGLQKDFGESRCFDTPLMESGIVGAAIGMAVAGLRPVVEIQFSGFALLGLQPDRQSRRPDQEQDARFAYRAHGHPNPVRRGHPRARAPLREHGSALRPYAGAQGRGPFHSP